MDHWPDNPLGQWIYLAPYLSFPVTDSFQKVIVAAVGLGWYFTHNDNSNTAPKAIGGSANEKLGQTTAVADALGMGMTSTSLHVSPTNTVARREEAAQSTALPHAPIDIPLEPVPISNRNSSARSHHNHNSRTRNLNRASH